MARIDQLFRDLIEVAACSFNGCPARFPAREKQVVVGRADDLVEVFVDEEKLRQFVQRFVVVPKFCPMTVLGQYLVAEAVDGRDRQFGKVAGVLHFAGRRSQSVTHLEGGLLGEGAKHNFLWLGLVQQQNIQSSQDNAEGLAGSWSRDHE